MVAVGPGDSIFEQIVRLRRWLVGDAVATFRVFLDEVEAGAMARLSSVG